MLPMDGQTDYGADMSEDVPSSSLTEPSRKRGRPRQFAVDTAVEIAQSMFAERGYEGTGVADLCSALGITATSLYSAWGSKLGLFEACLDAYAQDRGAFVGEALSAAATVCGVWRRVLERAAETYGRVPGQGCMVLDGMVTTYDADARAAIARFDDATRTAIRTRFAELGHADPAREADALVCAMRGLSASARSGRGTDDLLYIAARLAEPRHNKAVAGNQVASAKA